MIDVTWLWMVPVCFSDSDSPVDVKAVATKIGNLEPRAPSGIADRAQEEIRRLSPRENECTSYNRWCRLEAFAQIQVEARKMKIFGSWWYQAAEPFLSLNPMSMIGQNGASCNEQGKPIQLPRALLRMDLIAHR
jgi:hypothetical protein